MNARRFRHQTGSVVKDKRRKCWFGRWYDNVVVDGQVRRKLVTRKLADIDGRYKHPHDVQPLLDDILRPINEGKVDARSTMTLAAFVDKFYLPYVQENLKPSTSHGYRKLWQQRLLSYVGNITLRDFKTKDVYDTLLALCRDGLGRHSLYHVKALLSGIFAYAINVGVLNVGVNVVRPAMIPKRAKAGRTTQGYTAEEVMTMLRAFDTAATSGTLSNINALRCKTAISLCFFAGLRPGEARGARWEDVENLQKTSTLTSTSSRRCTLTVRQSVWHKHTTLPKTAASMRPVPIIEPLRSILMSLRNVDVNVDVAGPILRGPDYDRCMTPLNLDRLARVYIKPTLVSLRLPWHGYYALRRGIGTLTTTLAKDANAAKGLLRHTSLSTTLAHYVLDVPAVTLQALDAVESLCNGEGHAA